MRIPTRLLLIGLFACSAAFYARVAPLAQQQPGTVTVRPRIITTQPGVPEVKVAVDRNRVPAGSEVIFVLSPARVVSDSHYRVTIFFGDGKRQVVRQAKISHVYPQAGNYTYSILVEAEKQSTPTPTPAPPVPSVKLLISPTATEVKQPVSFSAQVSRRYPNLKYRFVFGDGSDTGWQDEARAIHSYRAANTFRAYVDIGVPANGSVKQAGGSEREAIRVTEPSRQVNASVKLSANPTSIESGKSVTFAARATPQSPNASYRFDFGDQAATEWQANPRATHRYNAAGKYSARVEFRIADRANGPQTASDSTTIEVSEPAGKSTIDLKIIPPIVPFGIPVLFQAVPSAAAAKAVYRFNFGDGSAPTNWSLDSVQTHVYAAPGNYPAFVEMLIAGNEPVASGRKRVRVTSIGPGGKTNGNPNSNTNRGNNANSNATPRSNTNSGGNSNSNGNVTGNTNSNRNSNNSSNTNTRGNTNTGGNANANIGGQVNGNVNSSGNKNSNINANVNANIGGQVNGNVNSSGNTNSNINANANANGGGNGNANANGNSAGSTNSNSNVSPAATQDTGDAGKAAWTDWWKYLIIAAIIVFAAYQAFSYFYAPRPKFVPHFDPGDSKVGAGKPLSIDLQMDVDPNIRDGEVTIDTQGNNLIKSKRTEP